MVFLSNVTVDVMKKKKMEIRESIKELFVAMNEVKSKLDFDSQIEKFWKKYSMYDG